MMYWGNHMGAGDWVFSILGTLIILALIVGVAVLIAQSLGTGAQAQGEAKPDDSAREILDRRLASGELTIDQYRALRETLEANGYSDRTALDAESLHGVGAAR